MLYRYKQKDSGFVIQYRQWWNPIWRSLKWGFVEFEGKCKMQYYTFNTEKEAITFINRKRKESKK